MFRDHAADEVRDLIPKAGWGPDVAYAGAWRLEGSTETQEVQNVP